MKKIKLYVFTAVVVDLEEEDKNNRNVLRTNLGYFTNLKKLYNILGGDTLQSYSTISGILQKKGIYTRKNISIVNDRHVEHFHEITIRKVDANQVYGFNKYFSLSELLSNEISKVDFSLGKLHYFRKI
ncbi:MAG: hypothetical protein K0B10_15700 [Vicingaceae bacterium]|nr:hypothetical protein [Vicingaceae bacterium]